ncbi:hypothetical protein ACHHYP_15123 [Achlya hypogyna]|uniref:Uncharacterized protein n=1 Tax=Achlya hypogyna TaxID=1202772 RepID=A0A1V9ZEZ7_ACHHY|nr:hypothetical protein ACHHYP_15123 [Achlya hypogyna]
MMRRRLSFGDKATDASPIASLSLDKNRLFADRCYSFEHPATLQRWTLTLREHHPLGIVWPSALALTQYLLHSPSPLTGRRILEIGAGTGITSLVCGALGAHTVATDMNAGLSLLQGNIQRNSHQAGGQVHGQVLEWRDIQAIHAIAAAHGPFDYVVGSDILYNDASHGAILDLLLQLTDPAQQTEVILSYPRRSGSEDGFFRALEQVFRSPPN